MEPFWEMRDSKCIETLFNPANTLEVTFLFL